MKNVLMLTTAAVLAFSTSAFAQEGKEVYDKSCVICHSSGVAGAPKTNDTAAWAPRLTLGIETLVATVKTGKGAMPAGGMCNDCTDEDYKKAIEYMTK